MTGSSTKLTPSASLSAKFQFSGATDDGAGSSPSSPRRVLRDDGRVSRDLLRTRVTVSNLSGRISGSVICVGVSCPVVCDGVV